MSDEFRMLRYTPADQRGVFELMRAAVSEKYAHHLVDQWNWKYDSHPLNTAAERARKAYRVKILPRLLATYPPEVLASWGVSLDEFDPIPDDAPYILLLKDGARVIAMVGTFPQEFLIAGTPQLVTIGCDSAVHPDYRGKFLSMRLTMRLATEHHLVATWSNRSTEKVRTTWRKRNASQAPANHPGPVRMRVVALVKPLDWSYMVHRATGVGLPRAIAKVMTSGAYRAGTRTRLASSGVDVFRMESFDHRIDDLWRRASLEHEVIAIRDANYLNWRFNSRPEVIYQCLAATRGDNLIGYLIYRIVEQDGAPWGYIVDFLAQGDPSGAFAMLLERAEELMLREGVKSIVCSMAKASFRRVLRRAGFYPAVFGEPLIMTAGITQPGADRSAFVELPSWFVTMADGDAEVIL
jgi:hypothetical protein